MSIALVVEEEGDIVTVELDVEFAPFVYACAAFPLAEDAVELE